MSVHIACRDDGHVVPRMMSWLAEALGWTIGNYVSKTAVVNYYAPYTMLALYGDAPTLTTGWFTHFESGTPGKVEVWHQADRSFDLRLVTSPVYESILNGRVTRVTPGIDLDHFAPTKGAKRGSRLGLSGIGSNRKGLELAHALIPYDLAVVAGRGWGLPETWVEYADMPAWYSQIDTYVCTATEEGIPAPVLEAMACGCKAVLPYGVGICDLLAGSPGVFMYQKGDPVSLRQAVDEAIAAKVSRVDIRDAVQGYGIASWVESNRTAVEELLDAPGSD